MSTALCIVRTSLALWFCLGAQVHLSLDHVAYWEHEAEGHGHDAQHAEHSQTSLHCACGTVDTSHHHHGHHVIHDHEVDAVTVKSAHRALVLMAAAVVPALSAEIQLHTALAAFDVAPVRMSPLYLSRESVPRAPPAA